MDLSSQLRAAILAQSLPTPSSSFLTTLTTARSPPLPLPSLLATAKSRLLACDLTSSSSSSILDRAALSNLPADIDNASVVELKLPRDIHVQVVDIENLSLSRWEQVEELEAIERGEKTRGREVIRVTAEDDNREQDTTLSGQAATQTATQQQQRAATNQSQSASSNIPPTAGRNTTHRLVLQDSQGKRVFAIELKRIDRVGVGKTCMGEKMLLRAGTTVARGTLLLTPESCVLLGGKIDAWHDTWMEGRLARLKEAVGSDRPR